MDHPETDKVLAQELQGVLKELREKNTKLTNEKKAAKAGRTWGWTVAVITLFVLFLVMCGNQSRHHHW